MAVLPESSIDLSGGVEFVAQPSLTWKIDRAAGRIAGTCDGYDAVKQAVEIILNVERYRWQIYQPASGMQWEGLVGQDAGYVATELQRRLQDALLADDRIIGLKNYEYDTEGLESGYTTSAIRTVRYNVAPAINASSTTLGEKNAPFSFNYTVTDADGDTLTVTEKLDGKTTATRTGIASGTALTFEQAADVAGFQRILNGNHTLTVEARDGKETTSASATFTKAVHAASVTLTTPLAVDGDITVAILQVSGSIPNDAAFKAEATNNALDDSPVWQDVTAEVRKGMNIVFENQTASAGAAFNFRISVERGASGEGGYIDSVSGAFQ